jgi:hypothetical protein
VKATRRTALKSGLKSAAKVSAALAVAPAAALAISEEREKTPTKTGREIVRFFDDEDHLHQTFVVFCPSLDDWKALLAGDRFLRFFHVCPMRCGVIAMATFNTREMLRRFGILDPVKPIWTREPDLLGALREQWDWLETSPIAQRFAER